MTVEVGVNSYVTVAEATAYFAARYGYGSWVAETNKEGALVSATQILDNYCDWYGYPVADDQALAFPRFAIDWEDDGLVPQEIKDAQYEIAYLIITQGSLNQRGDDALEEMKAGSVSMKFKARATGNPLVNALVDSLLLPFGICSGSGSTKVIPLQRC